MLPRDLSAPFTLKGAYGRVRIFETIQDLADWLDLRPDLLARISAGPGPANGPEAWVEDRDGRIMKPGTVRTVVGTLAQRPAVWPWRTARFGALAAHCTEMGLPIPGTGRRSSTSLFRHPRTWQEIAEGSESFRLAEDEIKEMGFAAPVRGRRRKLPTAWDDHLRSDHGSRSWKSHRRTRHRKSAVDTLES
jgi:hypothetical protein